MPRRRRALLVAAVLAGGLHVSIAAGLLAERAVRPSPAPTGAPAGTVAVQLASTDGATARAPGERPEGEPAGGTVPPAAVPPDLGVTPSAGLSPDLVAALPGGAVVAAPAAGTRQDPGRPDGRPPRMAGPDATADRAVPGSTPTDAVRAAVRPEAHAAVAPAAPVSVPTAPDTSGIDAAAPGDAVAAANDTPDDRRPAAAAGSTPPVPAPPTGPDPRSQAPARAAVPGSAPAPVDDSGPVPAPPVPTYPVRLPAARTLAYDLTRGMFSGTGDLRWEPTADGRYEARMDGRVAGFVILQWASRGTVDRWGLAPVRFTDRRRGGPELAANFVRDQSVVRYSGPGVVHALPAGGQDRLSWMVQIAAIVQARPSPPVAGDTLQLWVTGARGDADVWTFRCHGWTEVVAGGRPLRALAFTREPREPHDTRVEVWLDPAREHLPVRARLGSARGDDTLELVLRP